MLNTTWDLGSVQLLNDEDVFIVTGHDAVAGPRSYYKHISTAEHCQIYIIID